VVPLFASLAILSFAGSQRRAAAGIAIAAQVIALGLAVLAFAQTLGVPGFRAVQNFTWFTFGENALRLGFVLDPLTAAMLVMITFVALWIFVFSVGYMAEDRNFARFFAYLSFFTAAMLGVVIANSLLLLFVCWELVGLASYLLIGFGFTSPALPRRRRRRSSPRASATSDSSWAFFGSTAAAGRRCSMTMARAGWKRARWRQSVRVRL
jgi:NADH-quinone oxidoreductase subunit L